MTNAARERALDALFRSTDPSKWQTDKGIVHLSQSKLVSFKEHPFVAYNEEKLLKMVHSIREHGILSPIVVRKVANNEQYEIIAGHNRVQASKMAKLFEVPVTIVEADDDTAMLMMIETNLNQREQILPSERGRAYQLQMQALTNRKNRGESHGETLHTTSKEIAEKENLSRAQMFRYIRLTELIPELLSLVDHKKLKLMLAVEISYLSKRHQQHVYQFLLDKSYKLNARNVAEMKELERKQELTTDLIEQLMLAPQKEEQQMVYKQIDKVLKRYKLPSSHAVNIISKALKMYSQTEEYKREVSG